MFAFKQLLSEGSFSLVGDPSAVMLLEFFMSFANRSNVLGTDAGLNSNGSMLCVSISFSISNEGIFAILCGLVLVLGFLPASSRSSRFIVKLFIFFWVCAGLELDSHHDKNSHIGSPVLKF
jgi:hypothetical protein